MNGGFYMTVFQISYGEHPSQFGVLRLPDLPGRSPVVITIHGGFLFIAY